MEARHRQRTFALGAVVGAGCPAEAESQDGAKLRFRPDLQRLGHGAIIEVDWQSEAAGMFGLIEVAPDGWGGLEVEEANVPNAGFLASAAFRLPSVPTEGWRHAPDCDGRLCHS